MWIEPCTMYLIYVFDHVQTLPHGRGPVILIMGGIAMLFLSLFAALVSHRHAPQSHIPMRRSAAASLAPRAVPIQQAHSRNLRRGGWIQLPEAQRVRVGPAVVHEEVLQAVAVTDRDVWLPRVIDAAIRADLGKPRILTADQGRHALLVTNCRTCTDPRRDPEAGCEHERSLLERALRQVTPDGRVIEVSCRPKRAGACIFEILPGGKT